MSVDLAGSTAFKSGKGSEPVNDRSSQARWVQETRKFYQEFPKLVLQKYSGLAGAAEPNGTLEGRHPHVWKTLGDEILFCCRTDSLLHLSVCVEAFLQALHAFGTTLDRDRHLDVKGAGWIAAFPAPNVSVALDDTWTTADQFGEAFESRADSMPRDVDFLGNGIDCGFRVAGKSAVDRFVMAAELAWLLAEAKIRGVFPRDLWYDERHVLKGVIKDRPYPIIYVETERSLTRGDVRSEERKLLNQAVPDARTIRNFLGYFMTDENIDLPHLPDAGPPVPTTPPASYQKFLDKWLAEANDVERQTQTETESERPDHGDGTDLPSVLREDAGQIVADAQKGDQKRRT